MNISCLFGLDQTYKQEVFLCPKSAAMPFQFFRVPKYRSINTVAFRIRTGPFRVMSTLTPGHYSRIDAYGLAQRLTPLGQWRRIRDSNPGTGIAGLSHFECDLFDHLSNPPYSVLTLRNRLNFVGEKTQRNEENGKEPAFKKPESPENQGKRQI